MFPCVYPRAAASKTRTHRAPYKDCSLIRRPATLELTHNLVGALPEALVALAICPLVGALGSTVLRRRTICTSISSALRSASSVTEPATSLSSLELRA